MREYHYKCKMMGRCKYAYVSSYTRNMISKTLKHVRLFPFSTCLLSLPGRKLACSGGDATENVGVASCEAVSELLSPMSMGTVSNYNNNNNTCIHNVLYHVYV